MANGKLTDKQQLFVYAYLQCWNATKAARQAGYSEKYLHTNANKILQNTTVQAEIEQQLKKYAMGTREVLARLTHQARGDIGDFAHIESTVDLANHPQSYIVKKFKKRKTYSKDGEEIYEDIELELYDSHAPLVDLGKHYQMFTDKVEITWRDTLPADIDPSEVIKQFASLLAQAKQNASSND